MNWCSILVYYSFILYFASIQVGFRLLFRIFMRKSLYDCRPQILEFHNKTRRFKIEPKILPPVQWAYDIWKTKMWKQTKFCDFSLWNKDFEHFSHIDIPYLFCLQLFPFSGSIDENLKETKRQATIKGMRKIDSYYFYPFRNFEMDFPAFQSLFRLLSFQ